MNQPEPISYLDNDVACNSATDNQDSLNNWQKLPDFLNNYPQFSEHQMRWLLMRRQENGLSECTRKIGKPLYINVPGFLKWIEGYSER